MAIDFPDSPTSNQIYTSGGRSWIWNGSSWVAYTTTITTDLIVNGTITSAMIADGTIANADINTSAAIAHSKLATATAGQILLGTTTTGVITATTVSGDVTITGAGVTAIGSGVIVNADINASAAIDKTKISGTAITAADTGTVTSTMIANGTIVAADIASSTITNAQIASATITNANLANTTVTVGSTAISLGGSNTTIAGLTSITSANANVSTALTTKGVIEPISVSATAATGTINIDFLSNPGVYYTTNASANWTLNVRGNSTTTLNSVLATGDMASITFMAQQGATAYFANVIQVDGSTITPKWQGGTAPTSGNASSIDAYSLTIVKTAASTFTVFASQTKFA